MISYALAVSLVVQVKFAAESSRGIEGLRGLRWLKILCRFVQGTPRDREVRCGCRLVGGEGQRESTGKLFWTGRREAYTKEEMDEAKYHGVWQEGLKDKLGI